MLVSVIVPTKNSAAFLDACLASIKAQTYSPIEIIVVDNFSTDDTQTIAKKYTDKVFAIGPERCTQRNHGAAQAAGAYIVFIDSDMTLSPTVIAECAEKMSDESIKGIIIPEESFGEGFWAQCKKLERSFYSGIDAIEAARFFRKTDFDAVGGYNEALVSGEDWDLSDRIEMRGPLERVHNLIYHNEGRISLTKTLQKKYYYSKKAGSYLTQSQSIPTAQKRRQGVVGRYHLFLSKPKKLFANPLIGAGMLFMKTCEFAFGGFGILVTKTMESGK
jgi:glycosyltransferase involved in cell wall biosynthesis